MPRRYSFIIADRDSGVTHRFTLNFRYVMSWLVTSFFLLIGGGLYLNWSVKSEIEDLTLRNAQLQLEASSYRVAGTELSDKVILLQTGMTELAERVGMINPSLKRVGNSSDDSRINLLNGSLPDSDSDKSAFDVLNGVLKTLDSKLQVIRQGVAYREALSDATPFIWPADGWLSGMYGYRPDPFTGQRDFHPGIDISTRRGQPVYSTATGRISTASHNGSYGNLVEIDHGFGLTTRYGHLSAFAVSKDDTVRRGEVIGYAGATGRATGYHVHYEIWMDDRTINPMRLLMRGSPRSID